jgi:uncharacterized RDD family membrane protein YckC
MEKAGFGRRLGAVMLDWILAVASTNLFVHGRSLSTSLTRQALFFAEIALMTYLTQSSIGQRIFSIKVVDFQTGGRLSPLRVFKRTLLLALFIPAIFTQDGRGFHDVLSGSAVVEFKRTN